MSRKSEKITAADIISAFKEMTSDELVQISMVVDLAIEKAEKAELAAERAKKAEQDCEVRDLISRLHRRSQKTSEDLAADAIAKIKAEAKRRDFRIKTLLMIGERNAQNG